MEEKEAMNCNGVEVVRATASDWTFILARKEDT
jgi:hypothetical protein